MHSEALSNYSTCFEVFAREGQSLRQQHLILLPLAKRDNALCEVKRFIRVLDQSSTPYQYYCLPSEATTSWGEAIALHRGYEAVLGAILLDTLLVEAPARASKRVIPSLLIREFCDQLYRIAQGLKTGPIRDLTVDNDAFLKDLGICRLELFPGKAALIEKFSGIPRSLAFKGRIRQFINFSKLAVLNRAQFTPYFGLHVHNKMLTDFNSSGWDRCYNLAAELLRCYPEYLGLIGSSWFYDPEVGKISPQLSYLRERPLAGGACFFRVGSSQADVSNATRRDLSGQRLKRFEEGKYHPTSYMMVWPRKEIIAWSDRSWKGLANACSS